MKLIIVASLLLAYPVMAQTPSPEDWQAALVECHGQIGDMSGRAEKNAVVHGQDVRALRAIIKQIDEEQDAEQDESEQ
jgi:hypothetical protein